MNEIKITHELCAEDRARLDRLAEALEKNTHNCESCVETAIRMTQATQETPKAAREPKNEHTEATEAAAHPVEGVEAFEPVKVEKTAPEAEEKPEEVKPAVTVKMSEIQQKVVALSAAGKKAEVKAIVTAYSDRVTSLPEDKWGEVFEQLTALEQTLEG